MSVLPTIPKALRAAFAALLPGRLDEIEQELQQREAAARADADAFRVLDTDLPALEIAAATATAAERNHLAAARERALADSREAYRLQVAAREAIGRFERARDGAEDQLRTSPLLDRRLRGDGEVASVLAAALRHAVSHRRSNPIADDLAIRDLTSAGTEPVRYYRDVANPEGAVLVGLVEARDLERRVAPIIDQLEGAIAALRALQIHRGIDVGPELRRILKPLAPRCPCGFGFSLPSLEPETDVEAAA